MSRSSAGSAHRIKSSDERKKDKQTNNGNQQKSIFILWNLFIYIKFLN